MDQHNFERVEAEKQRHFDQFQMINEKTIDTSSAFIKSTLLINGGAVIAIMGLIASLISAGYPGTVDMVGKATGALKLFSWGVATSSLSFALAYFTHLALLENFNAQTKDDWIWTSKNKKLVHMIAILASAASLVLFILGVEAVGGALAELGEPK